MLILASWLIEKTISPKLTRLCNAGKPGAVQHKPAKANSSIPIIGDIPEREFHLLRGWKVPINGYTLYRV